MMALRLSAQRRRVRSKNNSATHSAPKAVFQSLPSEMSSFIVKKIANLAEGALSKPFKEGDGLAPCQARSRVKKQAFCIPVPLEMRKCWILSESSMLAFGLGRRKRGANSAIGLCFLGDGSVADIELKNLNLGPLYV